MSTTQSRVIMPDKVKDCQSIFCHPPNSGRAMSLYFSVALPHPPRWQDQDRDQPVKKIAQRIEPSGGCPFGLSNDPWAKH